MADPWYPELVRVFYSNLKISDGTLCSRVKGVDIKLTDDVWTTIVGFRGEKSHLGIDGLQKFSVYQDCLRNSNEPRDYSHYRTSGMKKDDCLCAFIITWILLPRGINHAQVLLHFNVDCVVESCETYSKRNIIDKISLHHMSLQHGPDGWTFKDENQDAEGEAPTGSSAASFKPKSEFEKYIVDRGAM
ncbi:hypothetical protein LR48_Vigan04g115900 [Vigna angularis]|uniref:Uncharacterized protein n=1 Tax=Phaseolus angularis TaxID=3914 RepID=A0A0L9UE48_PHAAN|nr:hypothetical protein LR48_Vigan04g115900 [Vigna angularis]